MVPPLLNLLTCQQWVLHAEGKALIHRSGKQLAMTGVGQPVLEQLRPAGHGASWEHGQVQVQGQCRQQGHRSNGNSGSTQDWDAARKE